MWLTHIAFGLPLAIFLLHNYMPALPRRHVRGGPHRRRRPPARSSGGSSLPLSVPALAAFAIFQFLWVWNDYLVALTFLGSVSPTTRR